MQSLQANSAVACMLSGASQGRPVIVGWSIAPCGQVIEESLGQLPKKRTAGPRVLPRTESSRSQLGTKQGGPPHDHWANLGQLRYTRSQYAFVVIALFSMNSSRCPQEKTGMDECSAYNQRTLDLRRDAHLSNPTLSLLPCKMTSTHQRSASRSRRLA